MVLKVFIFTIYNRKQINFQFEYYGNIKCVINCYVLIIHFQIIAQDDSKIALKCDFIPVKKSFFMTISLPT